MYIPPEYLSRGIRYIRPDLIPVRRSARTKERHDHILDRDGHPRQGEDSQVGAFDEAPHPAPYPSNPRQNVRPDHPEDIPGGHLLAPELEVSTLLMAQDDAQKRHSSLTSAQEEDDSADVEMNGMVWHGPVLDHSLTFEELSRLLQSVRM